MPKVLHRKSSHPRATFLATPCSGNVDPAFTFSLAESCKELTRQGIEVELEIYSENCHVDDGRNRLVRDFLDSDCDQLVFLDSDLRWEPEDLKKLILHQKDVVAGIYPLKQETEGYPVRHLPGDVYADEDGLVEVEGVPTGFLKIRRNVLEELDKGSEHFPSKDDVEGRRMIPIIFERTHSNNTRWGGDYTFCLKWRETGGKIYIDPNFRLEHYGSKCFSGTYMQYMKRKMGLGVEPMLETIRDCNETIQTIIDITEQWGNPTFQASPEFLYMCIKKARESKGDIVECGSGLSTLAMAVSTKHTVHCLEHNPIWATHIQKEAQRYGISNINIIYAPIRNKWYGVDSIPYCDLIVCDGPPRAESDRNKLKEHLPNGMTVLFDDYEELGDWAVNVKTFGSSRLSAIFEHKEKNGISTHNL